MTAAVKRSGKAHPSKANQSKANQPGGAIEVSIVVLSYDRIALLERTLRSCLTQHLPGNAAFELIVADNHADRLAAGLVERLAAESAVPICYLADPVRNVSIVRNVGIAAARGRYVAFIDDDEAAEPGWLAGLYACLERTGTDAAFGPKLPEFETGQPPDWDPEAQFYTCDFGLPEDGEIILFGRLRKRGKGLGTGNSMFRVATCFNEPEPFNVDFGNGNGEDTQLFFRLMKAGRRFVWCPSARVVEFIQAERMRFAYMRTRMKRGSQHYAVSRVATSRNRTITAAKVALLGMAQIAVHAALYVATGEFLTPARVVNRIGMAKGLGKLTYSKPIGFIKETA
ncbi:MAG TPA: glycosyltransferase family A protein [Stellaceae bacterium]|nr:glycosyltransferase family A protein [Stellaceae bacterium]